MVGTKRKKRSTEPVEATWLFSIAAAAADDDVDGDDAGCSGCFVSFH